MVEGMGDRLPQLQQASQEAEVSKKRRASQWLRAVAARFRNCPTLVRTLTEVFKDPALSVRVTAEEWAVVTTLLRARELDEPADQLASMLPCEVGKPSGSPHGGTEARWIFSNAIEADCALLLKAISDGLTHRLTRLTVEGNSELQQGKHDAQLLTLERTHHITRLQNQLQGVIRRIEYKLQCLRGELEHEYITGWDPEIDAISDLQLGKHLKGVIRELSRVTRDNDHHAVALGSFGLDEAIELKVVAELLEHSRAIECFVVPRVSSDSSDPKRSSRALKHGAEQSRTQSEVRGSAADALSEGDDGSTPGPNKGKAGLNRTESCTAKAYMKGTSACPASGEWRGLWDGMCGMQTKWTEEKVDLVKQKMTDATEHIKQAVKQKSSRWEQDQAFLAANLAAKHASTAAKPDNAGKKGRRGSSIVSAEALMAACAATANSDPAEQALPSANSQASGKGQQPATSVKPGSITRGKRSSMPTAAGVMTDTAVLLDPGAGSNGNSAAARRGRRGSCPAKQAAVAASHRHCAGCNCGFCDSNQKSLINESEVTALDTAQFDFEATLNQVAAPKANRRRRSVTGLGGKIIDLTHTLPNAAARRRRSTSVMNSAAVRSTLPKLSTSAVTLDTLDSPPTNVNPTTSFNGLVSIQPGLGVPTCRIGRCCGQCNNQPCKCKQEQRNGSKRKSLSVSTVTKNVTDYYRVLGVTKEAPSDELKQAFRDAAIQFHPDRGNGSTCQFSLVNEAYRVLKDSRLRQLYNEGGISLVMSYESKCLEVERNHLLARIRDNLEVDHDRDELERLMNPQI